MEGNKQLELLKEQEKTRIKKLKTSKNRSYTFNFLQITFYYLFILSLLIKVKSQSQQDIKFKQYRKPYISLVIIGNSFKQLVGTNSVIAPNKAYISETFTPLGIDELGDYKININTKVKEINITLEFSEIDIDMQYLFNRLTHIKKADLSNYNIKPIDTSFMFSNCKNLEKVIFGNFDTSNVINMAGMFQFTAIKYLNLSNFKTSKVTNMNLMFNFCSNLTYLNLSTFDYSKVTTSDFMLNGCEDNLKYLNIYSYKDNDMFYDYFFEIANKDLIYCINSENAPELSAYLLNIIIL